MASPGARHGSQTLSTGGQREKLHAGVRPVRALVRTEHTHGLTVTDQSRGQRDGEFGTASSLPSRAAEAWEADPGCTGNGSRSRATLSRPASGLSVFIRLFCYVNRL